MCTLATPALRQALFTQLAQAAAPARGQVLVLTRPTAAGEAVPDRTTRTLRTAEATDIGEACRW